MRHCNILITNNLTNVNIHDSLLCEIYIYVTNVLHYVHNKGHSL